MKITDQIKRKQPCQKKELIATAFSNRNVVHLALRLQLSKEANVPPYVVFHDKTLAAMAALRPRDESELMAISGVGEAKLDRWGAAFLAALNEDIDPPE